MNEELDQIKKNNTRELVPRPKDKNVIGTKWVFGNKLNEDGQKKKTACRLKKALYGLKQVPRAWYARLDEYLRQQGFKKGTADSNLYVQIDKDNLTIVEVYVDDILFGSNDDRLSENFATKMQSEFEMSLLGELTYFLGPQISQQEKGIFICQAKYIKEMLKKFKVEDCKPVLTPMVTCCKLSIDDSSEDVDQRLYRSMIDSLLYVTTTRPDVMQIVARFHATPKESHIIPVKRILRYLKGTTEYGLWYPKGNNLIIQAFTDADWARSIYDRKSTSRAAFYLGGCLVSWLSKKQTSILLSTAEAEYITVATSCTQVLWMKQTLQDLQVQFSEPISIFCDNTSAISVSKNPVMHSKTKHILIKYHFVREQVAEKNIKLEYVGTKEQIADIFTKPLPHEAFEYLRQKLGILPSSH
eukprot:PITA_18100